ncbi:MAG TPA: hypothetical protein VET48_03630, partial [Steroidobacteraceae bacterium]|nr:hypothetical protein [Steroidobacteraceae bacterium]
MPYSRHSVSILQDALGAHWASGRHTRGRKLSAFIVRMLFAAVICALLYSAIARAEEPERGAQSLQAIRTAAEQYVREAAEKAAGMPDVLFVAAAELDLRLQLTNCVNELHAFILNSTPLGARNIVGVRCSDFNGPGWTVYVPVTVEIEKPVFVMRRSVPRDAHIVADDVELKSLRLAGLGTNYVSDLTSLRDQHLK